MENDILSEVKKPLTERGWKRVDSIGYGHYKKNNGHVYDSIDATFQQAYWDQPALIARIEALEAEREKIAEMRQEFLDDFSGGIICKRVREEGVYTVGNYSFLGKAFDEEYDIISIIDRHFPSPPDRAQGVKG